MAIFYWLRSFFLYKILKIKTFGVRVAIFSNTDKVLLVRHKLHHLWVFPGGGIKRGETPVAAAQRELFEETNFSVTNIFTANFSETNSVNKLNFFAKYKNNSIGKLDTVYLFTGFTNEFLPAKNKNDFFEIAEIKWFSLSDLPKNISDSTKNRILEIKNPEFPISKIW